MAKKTTAKKKKSPSAPSPAAKRTAPKRATKSNSMPAGRASSTAASSVCYVTVSPAVISVARSKTTGAGAPLACQSFEEAKAAAIDALVMVIEDAERRLHACKRAATLKDLAAD